MLPTGEVDLRQDETRRLMMLTPDYLITNQENIHEPITPCSLNSIRLLKQSASDQVTGGVLPLVGWVLLAPLLKCSAKRHHVYAAFVWLFLLFKNNFCFSLQLLNLYAWNFKLLPYYIPKN